MPGLGEVLGQGGSPLSQSSESAFLVRHELRPFSGPLVPQSVTLVRIHSTVFATPTALSHSNSCASSVLKLPLRLFLWEKCTPGSKQHYQWQLGSQTSPQKPIKYIEV